MRYRGSPHKTYLIYSRIRDLEPFLSTSMVINAEREPPVWVLWIAASKGILRDGAPDDLLPAASVGEDSAIENC